MEGRRVEFEQSRPSRRPRVLDPEPAMKRLAVCLSVALVIPAIAVADEPIPNPAIDMDGYLQVAREAAKHRATRRVSEADFLRMSREPGTIVLDARSREKFDLLHVEGAINLSFPDIAVESLRKMLPDRSARILIYCNNNFLNNEEAFASKLPRASLNLSTYIALYTYGYRNVYELGPRVDPKQTKLTLVSTVKQRVAAR
jgi:phage shock protein E